MMALSLLLILALFFALNMGGSSFASAFAPAYGGRLIGRLSAHWLFVGFVVVGAVLYGQNVSRTIGEDILLPQALTAAQSRHAVLIIFLCAGASMFTANLMHVPQTTSLVTVAAMAGTGAALHALNIETLLRLFPYWIILPVVSFALTFAAGRFVYPPRRTNFWIYEKLVNHQKRLRGFVIICCCYNAFSVGTNNVANVAGPLAGGALIPLLPALILMAVIYGSGAVFFSGPLKTVGTRVVPLGLLTVSIMSLVSGSLMLAASAWGVPQSFVMLQMGALFAIAFLKNGPELTLADPVLKKTLYTWTINPALTFGLSYGLAYWGLKT